ncbi:MAG: hypothetical protein WD048_17160 [Chitinophagales bacterium]
MKTDSLKISLIQWLSNLEDKHILESLVHFKSLQEGNDWWDTLSKAQQDNIEKGIEQAENGEVISSQKLWERYGRLSSLK